MNERAPDWLDHESQGYPPLLRLLEKREAIYAHRSQEAPGSWFDEGRDEAALGEVEGEITDMKQKLHIDPLAYPKIQPKE